MASTKIQRYQREFGIKLERTTDFDKNNLKKNLIDGEYFILDSSTLSKDNPFKDIETNSENLTEIIGNIALYYESTGHKTKVMNSFGPNPPNIYFYKKDGSELYSKIDIKDIIESRKYSNYLRSFIIYDKLIEYINRIPNLEIKTKLLNLCTDNKQKIIIGSSVRGPSIFVTTLWDIISKFINIKDDYLDLLKIKQSKP